MDYKNKMAQLLKN